MLTLLVGQDRADGAARSQHQLAGRDVVPAQGHVLDAFTRGFRGQDFYAPPMYESPAGFRDNARDFPPRGRGIDIAGAWCNKIFADGACPVILGAFVWT